MSASKDEVMERLRFSYYFRSFLKAIARLPPPISECVGSVRIQRFLAPQSLDLCSNFVGHGEKGIQFCRFRHQRVTHLLWLEPLSRAREADGNLTPETSGTPSTVCPTCFNARLISCSMYFIVVRAGPTIFSFFSNLRDAHGHLVALSAAIFKTNRIGCVAFLTP